MLGIRTFPHVSLRSCAEMVPGGLSGPRFASTKDCCGKPRAVASCDASRGLAASSSLVRLLPGHRRGFQAQLPPVLMDSGLAAKTDETSGVSGFRVSGVRV